MSKKAIILVLLVVVVMIGAAIGIYIVSTQKQDVRTEAAEGHTDLTLIPTTGNFSTGDTFDLQVQINTNGDLILSSDIFLNYNPEIIKAVSVTNGGFLETETANIITSDGTVIFSSRTATAKTGSGTLATVRFEALSAGTSDVIFGSNTTVAGEIGGDSVPLLRDTFDSTITITGDGGTVSPSPSLSPSISPSPSPSISPGLSPSPSPSGQKNSPSPTIKPTSTPSGGLGTPVPSSLPDAGIDSPTFVIIGSGLLFMLFALALAL